ncbi:MAG: class IV adenylate cyclase [Ignavibacteriales bacterium]
MAKNLEIKLKIVDHEQMIEKAKFIGADFIKELNQKDIYYKYENGLLKLRIQNGDSELIKYNRDEKSAERWSEYYVLKICDENPESFFSKLFHVEVIVEKLRRLFIYKNTRIHVDTVKNLGDFLELETVSQGNEIESKLEFDEVVAKLGLDVKSQIRNSYRDLLKNDSV